MQAILECILAGAPGEEIAHLPLPDSFVGAGVRRADTGMFEGLASRDKDPRRSVRLEEVGVPELAPDEVLVAVMASSINYNTVWSATFEPLPTFAFLDRYGRESRWGRRHALDFHVLGTDAAGVVARVGAGVRTWKPGDRVLVHSIQVDAEEPSAHDDAMLAASQRAWGFETNFGGLATLCLAKASQLLPKPRHLTWEEAASTPAAHSTVYRMLVGRHGARMVQGDVVFIWGATGGMGGYAVQVVLNGGGTPVGVVSSPEKVALLRAMGCEHAIDRRAAGYRFWQDEHTADPAEWRRLGADVRKLVGEDPHIVFEHPGRETMGASVFLARRGGTVVTCAATSGPLVEFDNRHLWMKLKRLISSHAANYAEAWAANRLVSQGRIHPTLSAVYPLSATGEAARLVQQNLHEGKVGVLCLAPREGLGVEDPELRARVGEERITLFRRHAAEHGPSRGVERA